MLDEQMQDALNSQINAEYFSSYLYLSMAGHAEAVGLPGVANWLHVQVKEENDHAMKLFGYVLERGGRVVLGAIEAPKTEWSSPVALFEAVVEHERLVTSLINKLVDLSVEQSDHATGNFLQWFVGEQVEEEAAAEQIFMQVKMVENAPGGLFMIDRELALRTYVPPPASTT